MSTVNMEYVPPSPACRSAWLGYWRRRRGAPVFVRRADLCNSDDRPSDHQTIRPSDHQTIRPSDHQTIRPSDPSRQSGVYNPNLRWLSASAPLLCDVCGCVWGGFGACVGGWRTCFAGPPRHAGRATAGWSLALLHQFYNKPSQCSS